MPWSRRGARCWVGFGWCGRPRVGRHRPGRPPPAGPPPPPRPAWQGSGREWPCGVLWHAEAGSPECAPHCCSTGYNYKRPLHRRQARMAAHHLPHLSSPSASAPSRDDMAPSCASPSALALTSGTRVSLPQALRQRPEARAPRGALTARLRSSTAAACSWSRPLLPELAAPSPRGDARRGTGRAPPLFRPRALMTTSQIASAAFTWGTVAVLPYYTLMVVAPNANITKRTVESSAPYVALGLLYAYLLYLSWTPDTLRAMFASKYWLPELPGIVRMFASEMTVASAWIHLLAVDLFAARQVYHDGLKNNIETRHSVSLCLLFCPVGILVHVATKVLAGAVGRSH